MPNFSSLTDASEQNAFVSWFRTVAPYVHAFKRKVFVIAFPGELVQAGKLEKTAQDIALLRALGIRVVVVHGSRPQIEQQLRLRQHESQFVGAQRITDATALECAKHAAGAIRLDIEAAFSQGLANTPMANANIKVVSGNFVSARPVGVVNGVDFQYTGVVSKVSTEVIELALNAQAVVLVSPLGYSPTGEALNLSMPELASQLAVALHAEKLVFLTEPNDQTATLPRELTQTAAKTLLASGTLDSKHANYLQHSIAACEAKVARAHMVSFGIDGALMLELFTHYGVGSMVSRDDLQFLREAQADDVGALWQLIEPLEQNGTLAPRGRHLIERDIAQFSVIEHDHQLIGCAALYCYPEQGMAEMACLTVQAQAQSQGEGARLLQHLEQRARAAGMQQLFVLTTRTAHWFLKRGFRAASPDELPASRRAHYDASRNSHVYFKSLTA